MGNSHSDAESQQEITDSSLSSVCRLYDLAKLEPHQWPIIYSPVYNISFWGLQNIHPFDSGKWGKVFQHLIDAGMLKGTSSIVTPHEVTESELKVVHTDEYIKYLTYSKNVAMVVEVPPVAFLLNSVVQHRLLRPFRYATGGTIMAGKLAKERGWAINIGGGFHHCSKDHGGGFCAYADITLSITFMFKHLSGISKVMIVDLDAHQGNGHERDFYNNEKVYILDMYNKWIYPNDGEAKAAIDARIELDGHTRDDEYLDRLSRRLPTALEEFDPDMVVYNAGTDVLIGDALGQLDVTPEGVKKRDLLVFKEVRKKGIPIFMVTSGGYQKNNAQVIADSILNLKKNKLISSPEDDPHISSELRAQGATLGSSSVDTSQSLEQSAGSVGMELTSSQDSKHTVGEEREGSHDSRPAEIEGRSPNPVEKDVDIDANETGSVGMELTSSQDSKHTVGEEREGSHDSRPAEIEGRSHNVVEKDVDIDANEAGSVGLELTSSQDSKHTVGEEREGSHDSRPVEREERSNNPVKVDIVNDLPFVTSEQDKLAREASDS